MLWIHLPNDELQGMATINGGGVEFKIDGNKFSFRGPGESWDERKICGVDRGETLTTYYCTDADGTEPTIICPTNDDLRNFVIGQKGGA